jgi:murein DD-endopeptidase MepM/ murein hydrolase activator NlpD
MRNAAPEQMQEMGRAQLQAGTTVMRIGQRIQDEIDEAETKAADVAALRQAQEILRGENGYLRTTGKNAETQYQSAQEALAKVFQDTESQLTNDVQKRMFQQVATRNLLTLQGQMADHKFREVKVYSINESRSRMELYTAEAIQNYESRGQKDENGAAIGAYNTAINTALAEADNLARLNGLDLEGSQAKALRNSVYSTVTMGVVSRLLDDDNPAAARAFYDEQVKAGRLDEQTALRLNSAIDGTEDKIEVVTAIERYTQGDIGQTEDGRTTASLIMPVDSTVVTSVVGDPRDKGKRAHNGIDLAVPVGTKVRAPYNGEVIQTWNDDKYGGGMSMRVRLDNGDIVGFAHLSGFDAKVGDRVRQGQVVARSGDTGTGGPHLHYTLKRNGKPIDPRTAGDIESGGGGGTPMQTTTDSLEKTLAAIDRDYADKPLIRDQIKAGVRQQWGQLRAIENERERELIDNAKEAWYKAGGDWRAIPNSTWAQLPEDVKFQLQKGLPRESSEETVLELIKNPQLVTPGNIEKYRDKLSEGDYRQFYARAYSSNETTVRAVSIDNQQLDGIFNANGLGRLVSPKAGTEDAAASIKIQNQIRDIIDTEQTVTGKELTRDRKRQIMEQVIMDQAFVSEWGRDPRKPVALLTEDEMAEAYVQVGGEEVKLTAIPAEQRRQITQTLTRRGRPVTEQAIAELWVKAGRPR